jgi:hypothetical protein
MGPAGRSACAKPGGSDCGGSPRRIAQLGSGGVVAGAGRRANLGVAVGARGCARTAVGCAASPVGRGAHAGQAADGPCCTDVGCGSRCTCWICPAGRPNLGRTRSSAGSGPGCGPTSTAGTPRGGAHLGSARRAGCAAGSGRPARASVGSARARRAQSASPRPATASRRGAARADLGITARRVGTRCRWLGASIRPAASAFVGSCTGTRTGEARSCEHRLGIAASERAAPDSTGAIVERAGRPIHLGRSQDGGACSPARAVVVGAVGVSCPCPCPNPSRRVPVVVIAAG